MKFQILPNPRLTIWQDDDSESPREWDNLGTLIFRDGRDNPPGDSDPIHAIRDQLNDLAGYADDYEDRVDELAERYHDNGMDWPAAERTAQAYHDAELVKEVTKRYHIQAVYHHAERGGVSLTCNPLAEDDLDDADGVIYVSRDRVKAEGVAPERVDKVLAGECSDYEQWLSGDVWGFSIEDEDGTHIDSCGGFYGRDLQAMREHIAPEYQHLLDNCEG